LIELANTKSQLKTAFTNLKPQEQKALTLLAIGYSYKDIAALTGWTYTKVNRCITEGRKQLRDSLSNTNNQGAGRRRGANKTSQPLTTS
jgi:DNA-directed RNA polymerase specialized sigma24 family protein